MDKTIGFVGAGQMASALAKGFLRAKLVPADQLVAYDPAPGALERFASAIGGRTTETLAQLVAEADILFLAMKPQHLDTAIAELSECKTVDRLVISIVAGARMEHITRGFGGRARIVRVMPNTPCLVGQGACGYCLGKNATEDDAALVQSLLEAVGIAYRVEERLMDAVTGLAGSGPAFVFLLIEALSDGGVLAGLPRPIATALAAQTVRGAAEMVLQTEEHPAQLKDKVASPAGTTIQGLMALELHGVRGGMIAAVEAAALRSKELGDD